jgi:beta-lactamase regulating signal transducer with metallopeptidase domain/HEAT repeat protein
MQLIGWTLIHSLWEGGAIAALLALAFSATRRRSPSLRYTLGMIGLLLMVALPLLTAMRMQTVRSVPKIPLASEAVQSPSVAAIPVKEPASNPGLRTDTERHSDRIISMAPQSIASSIEPVFPWLVAAWSIGLVLLSIRMIGGVARTRRIARNGSPASDRVHRVISRISHELGISRVIRSIEGTHVTVPVVIGWLRPVIVLPASLVSGMTASQLEMLLAHEIAHIRRYDFLANMLQTVIETLLFFHPAAWWLSDRIREERENCCDDIAVALCGGDRQGYTAALLALEESRDGEVMFAAAATGGGTLFRRAMRLLSGGPAHVELGARWIAGVITIFAAFFTTGPAIGKAANLPIVSPLEVMGLLSPGTDSVPRYSRGDANPDTVLIYSGSGLFGERWQWAEQRARDLKSRTYWIGYLVAGDATGANTYYSDRDVPVRSGNATFSGHMRIGSAGNLIFSGASLAPLVGSHSPWSIAIFLQFDRSNSDQVLRVHVGSFKFPVYFGGAPAIWLDSATDRESVAKLHALVASTRSLEKRRDLISAVGAHQDANATLPPLVGWLESTGETEGIRREAAEALGEVADPRAMTALARVARNDSNSGVRHEAVEAFGSMRITSATDTLIAFATNLQPTELRRAAIEELSSRHEARVVAFLKSFALTNNDSRLRRDAIESLGEMHEEGFSAVSDIALRASDVDTRQVAVEALGDTQPANRSLDLLAQIIRSDPDQGVRLKAVETLSDVRDDRASAVLRDLVTRSNDPYVQIKATEALGDAAKSDDDVRALVSVAKTHPSFDVRKKAIETLGDVQRVPSAGNALVEIVRSNADPELRRNAIDALGNIRSESADAALRAVALGNDPEGLRRQAMEAYTENVESGAAVEFLKSIIANDSSRRIRLSALEILSELNHDAGIPAVRELARSSADPTVRKQAVEILSEH